MSGVLYFDGQKPAVGAKLVIIVDSVNKPTGIWDGELIAIQSSDFAVYAYQDDHYLPGTRWVSCNAYITGPQAPETLIGHEPHVNYTAYLATSGGQYFRQRLNEAHTEIRGLKRHIEIELSSWHAMMKAIVNPETFPRLQQLLEEFLTRLGR